MLPLNTEKLEYVVLVGEKIIDVYGHKYLYQNFDNIGMQSGGWSLRWQGFMGNGLWRGENKIKSNASSILDGLNNLNQKVKPFLFSSKQFTPNTLPLMTRIKFQEKEMNLSTI